MNSPDPHRHATRAMRAHFQGRIQPADETALRAHLPTCASCRDRYDRHALFAKLVPGQPNASVRLARGLGLAPEPPARRAWRLAVPIPALAVAAALLFALGTLRRSDDRAGFASRGAVAAAPALWVYRVPAQGAPQAIGGTVHADDELAFAYSNPGGDAFALVFAVDEARRVFWFHPGWAAGEPAPRAVAVRSGSGPHELSAAIRHPLHAGPLAIYGWFTSEPTDVAAVEQAVKTAARFDGLTTPAGAQLARVLVEVTP
ncbi:MAG TPA: hypothetical protein VHU40_20650 [Polyangia bacterium]|nr:hypothetical protein [Polyangia bacterium]